ncbi:MAG: hypothetical protein JSS09_04195 [Verrucomicrobia bacterium]|nr:hypothetical protein [Verrucomicrobiota bacterium]
MNRRHNLANIRLVKKERKEVHKDMGKDTILKKTKLEVKKILATTPSKHLKKVSKRDSTHESIKNSSPSYPHKEGDRWISTLRTQQADKTIRFSKKEAKIKR